MIFLRNVNRINISLLCRMGVVCFLIAKPSGADLEFGPIYNYAVDFGPIDSVAADLDGDGDVDLAVINEGSRTVSILLQQNDGGLFEDAVDYVCGDASLGTQSGSPGGITTADFDHDGDCDLAISTSLVNMVTVMMNHGDGTFDAPTTYANTGRGAGVEHGDLNGDGHEEIIVACSRFDGGVNVFANIGDGTFPYRFSFPSFIARPNDVKVGDLDNDDDLDIVVGSYYNGAMAVYRNQGFGTFDPMERYPAAPEEMETPYIDIGDFNGDGWLDVISLDLIRNQIRVWSNNQDGSLGDPALLSTYLGPLCIRGGDIDCDNDLDIIHVTFGSSIDRQYLGYYLNDGTGHFSSEMMYELADDTEPKFFCLADIDRDTDLDVAINNIETDDVTILYNRTRRPVIEVQGLEHSILGVMARMFGEQALNSGPAIQQVSIHNAGTGTLRVTSATIVSDVDPGPDPQEFWIASDPRMTLEPGETKTIEVHFRPLKLGDTGDRLWIYTNDHDAYDDYDPVEGNGHWPAGAAEVRLEGVGVEPRITIERVDPASGATVPLPADGSPVDFGLATYDRPAAEHTFVASNVSAASVTLGSPSITSPFAAGADGLASPIASNTSDTFTLLLPTTSVGSFSGQVTLPIDGQEYPLIFYVSGEVLYPAPYWALQ